MQGSQLGPYRILSELGSGGMGVVYRARGPDGHVALKVLHPHLLSSPGFFERFLREAEIGRRVEHRNVVRTLDADGVEVDGKTVHYLVMEFVEGQTLRGLLEELERVPEELCRHIGREVAKGLQAIHAAGAIHRDLKPENVLITPEQQVKIMDLGVARLADEALRLSRSGAFVGSVLYAAPEQFGGIELDGRADLFALGVLLYELSSSAHPYPGDDFAEIYGRLMEAEPRRLGERNPRLSAFFEEVVHSLLRKERDERIASAAELLGLLTEGERSSWWQERAQALRAQTRRPLRRIRIPRETAVYGRDSELRELHGLFERARAGEGLVVLVEGEAGIGKTRLVDELVGRLQQDGEDLNFLFGSYPPGGAATEAGAWSTAYREHFGAEGLEQNLETYLPVTPALVPAFAALLRGEPPPAGKETLTKDALQTVFVHATRALAAERTTVVLIEDLHFAPEEGRALFAALALAVPEHRILLVGTARPGLPEEWEADLERLDHAGRMELARLGPKDLVRLLVDAFQSERLAEELGVRIAAKSDGNPFFVFEIIRGLREGRFITRGPDGTWATTRAIREIDVPSSVVDLVKARIADLEDGEREILDVAACLGFQFDPGLVAAVRREGIIPTLRSLAHLELKRRLVHGAGEQFVFDHHQVQEVIYAALPPRLAREYHAAIGDAIAAREPGPGGETAVLLVEHRLRGGQGAKAKSSLPIALDHLEAGYVRDRAVALLDRALETPGLFEGAERAELFLRRANLLGPLGRLDEEGGAIGEAVTLAEAIDDELLLTRALVQRGRWGMEKTRYDEGRADSERAIALAQRLGSPDLEADALLTLARTDQAQGRWEESAVFAKRALELARRTGHRECESMAHGCLAGVAFPFGRWDEVVEHLERKLAICREIGDRDGEARAITNLGAVCTRRGQGEAALEYVERGLAAARACGSRLEEVNAVINLAGVFDAQGRHAEACEEGERALAMCREIRDVWGATNTLRSLGNSYVAVGRYAKSLQYYERFAEAAQGMGDKAGEAEAHSGRGNVLQYLGAHEEAESALKIAVSMTVELGYKLEEAFSRWARATVMWQKGGLEDALRGMERVLALHRESNHPEGIAEALLDLGELRLESGEPESARELLEEGAALATNEGIPNFAGLGPVRLARLTGDVAAARAAVERHASRMWAPFRMEARFRLWRLSKDPADLGEAHAILRDLVAHAPERHRETMIRNVPLNRDITSAWEEHGC